MRNFLTAVLAAVGMAVLVGGVMAMVGGICQRDALRTVSGLGPFDGDWDPDDTKFLGGLLAPVGAAVVTFALLLRRKD